MTEVKLRSRDELEKELATQIALGTITSIEDAIESGYTDALEYGAQSIFDSLRILVVNKKNLPINIITYLATDRNVTVRSTAIKNNFELLPKDIQDEFIAELAAIYMQVPPDALTHSFPYKSRENSRSSAAQDILYRLFSIPDDILASKLLTAMKGIDGSAVRYESSINNLRKLPESCRLVYRENNFNIISIFHPDEEIRFENVKKLFTKSLSELRYIFNIQRDIAQKKVVNFQSYFRNYNPKGDIKQEVYALMLDDPSDRIRRFLVEHVKHIPTLEVMSLKDPNTLIRARATSEIRKLQKRKAYSQNYHSKKVKV